MQLEIIYIGVMLVLEKQYFRKTILGLFGLTLENALFWWESPGESEAGGSAPRRVAPAGRTQAEPGSMHGILAPATAVRRWVNPELVPDRARGP